MLSAAPLGDWTAEDARLELEVPAGDALADAEAADEPTTVGVGVRAREVGRATLRDLR